MFPILTLPQRSNVKTATRLWDGRQVFLRRVPGEGGQEIIQVLFEVRNHCDFYLGVIELPHTHGQRPPFFSCLDTSIAIPSPPTFFLGVMDPTLSSWLKNMNKLSSLIDRLGGLASSAPEKHRSQLSRKVATLRATFKKQQERCIDFLQLSEEYADKYLLDISTEIRQQSSFLDMLEKRLDMAKTLRQQAVDLRRSYESGTVATMKDVRTTGKTPSCCLKR